MKHETVTALQLLGSPTSEFFYDLSMLYGREVVCPQGFELLYAIVYPDASWRVTSDLNNHGGRLSLEEAIPKMRKADIAVPHLFCDEGLTGTRILIESTLGIPLVGSSGYTLFKAQNKNLTKLIARSAGVKVPDGITWQQSGKSLPSINLPVIIKPNNADNSDGLTLARNQAQLTAGIDNAFEFDDEILIEEYIAGRELRGGILEISGEFKVLPFIEYHVSENHPIRNAADKLKFDSKGNLQDQSDKKQVAASCPAQVDDNLEESLSEMMIAMHKALDCRDFSMFDFRVNEKGEPYLLEAGLFWSFSKKSMISQMLEAAKMDLSQTTALLWKQTVGRKMT